MDVYNSVLYVLWVVGWMKLSLASVGEASWTGAETPEKQCEALAARLIDETQRSAQAKSAEPEVIEPMNVQLSDNESSSSM